MFKIGKEYTKEDIYIILNVPESVRYGAWDIGYRKYLKDFFIFANIGVPGRTGHNYGNQWDGDDLVWFGNTTSHINQPSIQDLISHSGKVYIFTRTDNYKAWTYEGLGFPIKVEPVIPIKITWSFFSEDSTRPETLPEEFLPNQTFLEGSYKTIKVNKYERSVEARRTCIRYYGSHCQVCSFNFKDRYGSIGEDFIHVHHLNSIAEIKEEYEINPITDLVPVCPNCHAMIHSKTPAYTVQELKDIINALNELGRR